MLELQMLGIIGVTVLYLVTKDVLLDKFDNWLEKKD